MNSTVDFFLNDDPTMTSGKLLNTTNVHLLMELQKVGRIFISFCQKVYNQQKLRGENEEASKTARDMYIARMNMNLVNDALKIAMN